jgi:hypothetical protein
MMAMMMMTMQTVKEISSNNNDMKLIVDGLVKRNEVEELKREECKTERKRKVEWNVEDGEIGGNKRVYGELAGQLDVLVEASDEHESTGHTATSDVDAANENIVVQKTDALPDATDFNAKDASLDVDTLAVVSTIVHAETADGTSDVIEVVADSTMAADAMDVDGVTDGDGTTVEKDSHVLVNVKPVDGDDAVTPVVVDATDDVNVCGMNDDVGSTLEPQVTVHDNAIFEPGVLARVDDANVDIPTGGDDTTVMDVAAAVPVPEPGVLSNVDVNIKMGSDDTAAMEAAVAVPIPDGDVDVTANEATSDTIDGVVDSAVPVDVTVAAGLVLSDLVSVVSEGLRCQDEETPIVASTAASDVAHLTDDNVRGGHSVSPPGVLSPVADDSDGHAEALRATEVIKPTDSVVVVGLNADAIDIPLHDIEVPVAASPVPRIAMQLKKNQSCTLHPNATQPFLGGIGWIGRIQPVLLHMIAGAAKESVYTMTASIISMLWSSRNTEDLETVRLYAMESQPTLTIRARIRSIGVIMRIVSVLYPNLEVQFIVPPALLDGIDQSIKRPSPIHADLVIILSDGGIPMFANDSEQFSCGGALTDTPSKNCFTCMATNDVGAPFSRCFSANCKRTPPHALMCTRCVQCFPTLRFNMK